MTQTEILSYFNLETHPFSKEVKTDELMSLPTLAKSEQELLLLIETRGIGLFTGPSGCGKSSVLRKVATQLNPGLYRPFYVSHTSLGTTEFYQSCAASLGLSSLGRRSKIFRRIQSFITDLNDQKRIHPVIIIDEAQSLSCDSLQELRMLTNFDYDSKNACTLLLCGHSDLRQKLQLNVYSSLANSITYSIKLDALPAEETYSYIESRITSSGATAPLFTDNAKKLIHDISSGILRVAGNLAWRSVINAYQHQSRQVEKEHVQMVTSQ